MAKRFLFGMLKFLFTVTVLVHAKDPPGFISLDCGLGNKQSYEDRNTKLTYQSDESFIDTGESLDISSVYKTNSLERQFWSVRSFPDANRNCYSLHTPFSGVIDHMKYVIRARFLYGNYDNKNTTPKFDLYLDTAFWDTVEFEDASTIVTKEYVYSPFHSEDTQVCLCNTNEGTPFISVLELRLFSIDYHLFRGWVLARFNLGSEDGKIVRYPDDAYDRIWTPYNRGDLNRISIPYLKEIDESDNKTLPPSIVMGTAAIPANGNSIRLKFVPKNNASIFAYPPLTLLYFAELQELHNETRELDIYMDGMLMPDTYHPRYLHAQSYLPEIGGGFEIWINRTNQSTLPPLLNAIEIFVLGAVSPLQTHPDDCRCSDRAIMKIRQLYGIKKNWQGDPCTPESYKWEGLDCVNNGSEYNPYRIRSLDLSNSKLKGNVTKFLAELKFLKFLNIEGNQLLGTIPAELTDRLENGLQFRYDGNPGLCYPGPCKEKHKGNIVIPVAASFGGAFIIVLAIIIFSIFKRRQQVGTSTNKLSLYSNISKRLMLLANINKKVGSRKQIRYAEILSITNNFERVVGKGGFGTVYHGHLGNTQVAVKMLSPSTQGFLQFEAEAKLLTRVHHKCLTPLLGYCHEDTNIALIYEYMPKGDLAKHLSDSEKYFSWKERIQIAVDAAEGLEYLHNGCKAPIVHRDIKPRNILLNEKLRGKIADFGLSKIFPDEGDTHVFTAIAGTPGYLDPEYYMSNRLNEKSDVFSFGVVLLELITGRPAITKTEEKAHIIQWIGSMLPESVITDIVDSRLRGEFDIHSVRKALDTAMACVAQSSTNRPSMSQVVVELKQCLAMEMTRESDSKQCTSISFAESDSHRSITNRSTYVYNSTDRISVERSSLTL